MELNETKFIPRKSSEPTEILLPRFLTLHDNQEKEEAERALLAETLGVETREEQTQRREREKQQKLAPPVSSHRPASLPPASRLEKENEELPNFEDEFYMKKQNFRRHHRKEEQISWSRTNVDLLTHRKQRRDVQRESEAKKREDEDHAKHLEQELKET
jgi:hypothetical protein